MTYTTGELAKVCGVTVRTVQYYVKKGLIHPISKEHETTRRFDEESKFRMEIILILKGWGLTLKQISQLLNSQDEESRNHLAVLLEQRTLELKNNIQEQQHIYSRLKEIKKYVTGDDKGSSLEEVLNLNHASIQREKTINVYYALMKKLVPVSVLELGAITLSLILKKFFPVLLIVPYLIYSSVTVTTFMHKHVSYFCPSCYRIFKPTLWQFIKVPHTPKSRKLECPLCHKVQYCLEVTTEK
ncbi:MerR family transcriptional regulator [Staphylococcus pettenkoferi]|uniref:helix-turn-helix domain-containing protein n=1 Tax=Staphylococcus pettenkoferi TaxID=170573 RepID=UPI002553A477|nr:MerR family transcriptional regulator [Staphylococcus pettenkoferi]MDK7114847.1 MerR family transcriptional regulator [Staphylococcus pettenkoferi]MDK7283240.1 MerR family transcriptional regulator [Staphylococcus pettenkoferi]